MDGEIRNEIKNTLEACLHGKEITLEQISKIIDDTREYYHLSMIFAVSNVQYKYQLKHIVLSKDSNSDIVPHDELPLTVEQYERMVEEYKKHLMQEQPVSALANGFKGSILQCGIMQGDTYIGGVGFRDEKKRIWGENEKEDLQMLSRLLLIYIGLNQLDREQNTREQLICSMLKENTRSGFYLNLLTGECHGIRISSYLKGKVTEWDSYENLQRMYADEFMDPIYGNKMLKDFAIQVMRKKFQNGEVKLTMEYPRIFKDTARWFRYTVQMIDRNRAGEPYHAMITFDDITEETQKNAYFAHVSEDSQNNYIVIANVDLDTEQYGMLVDNRINTSLYMDIGATGSYREQQILIATDALRTRSIAGVDIEKLTTIFSIDNMKLHFDQSAEMLYYEFPIRVEETVFWVRMEAVPIHNYSANNRKIMLYYSDYTQEKEKEWKLEEINEVLEQEHKRIHKTEKLLLQDALTGAYNRKGFEKIVSQYKNRKEPTGFLMIDIDHFKEINDSFGHEFGDEVLIMVARQLQTVFRNEDKVFRLGGDEFAVLLCGCGSDAWDSIQMKFSGIHRYLKKNIENDIPITVSAGLTLSNDGYLEEMYGLSDEALYYTKSKGRAGLSQIDRNHNIVNIWNDAVADEARKSQIQKSEIGKWNAEYPLEGGAPRLFYDETAHLLLGIPDTLTPEECYTRWRDGVAPGYKGIIREMNERIVIEGQAECTYLWEHPVQGQIQLRDGGRLVENDKVRKVCGYVQSMSNTSIVLNDEEDTSILHALNNIYFCSYYIDLTNEEYYTFKGNSVTEGFDVHTDNIVQTLQNFIRRYIHPDFRTDMEAFVKLDTLPERLKSVDFIDCEYLSLTEKGWCRSRFMPVKWNEDGQLTHVLYVIYSIDAVKRKEIEKDEAAREALQIQLRIGEIISKSTVLSAAILNKNTGRVTLFNPDSFGEERKTYPFELVKEWGMQWVDTEDLQRYSEECSLKHFVMEIEEKGSYAAIYPVVNKEQEKQVIMFHCEPLRVGSHHLMLVIEDVTNVAKEEIGQMQELLTSEQKLLSCVQKMAGITDHHEAIKYLLDQIVDHYQCDRACLSHLTGEQQGTVLMESCSCGITPKFHQGEVLTLTDFMFWESVYSPIKLNKVYCEGDESEEQRWMREAGLNNLMILSFVFCEKEVGYISIDNIRRNKDNSNWISTLAFFIANEMQKLAHEEEVANLIYVDSMTGCKNRTAYNKSLEELKNRKSHNIGIVVASMNGLKAVNDAMGNQFGDQMIKKTVGILQDEFPEDEVYRISGDEFVIICIGKDYYQFVDRSDHLLKHLLQEEKGIASVGYVWSESSENVEELEKRAEKLMRSEKQNYYLRHQRAQDKRPAYIRHAAEELVKSKFVVYLQPKCYAKTEKVYGAEALVRKVNEDGTIVTPYEFISVLEQENLISNVDYFVLEEVCRRLVEWKQAGNEEFEISCNFSRMTIAENHFVDRVFEILDRTGVDSSKLIFEITESSNAVPFEKINTLMQMLKKRNIRFALDDMGTEYSTLQMLKLPNITTIKFDRTLIKQLEGDERERFIMQSMVSLCHGLGMECIAEGVEKREQLELLKRMKCDKIQGFLIGKPMPMETFEARYVEFYK